MPPSSTKQFSGIFVSYRRDDSSGHAGRLFDKLSHHFGEDQIFMDIDHIEPGEDFVQVIENAVASCEVLIAIIGRSWLSSTDGTSRRLDNSNDFVRLEIAAALNRDIRVIPVLVQRATMPKPQDLPEDLSTLSRRHALELTDSRWQRDVDQLIQVLEKTLAAGEERRHTAVREREERQRRDAEARLQAEEKERPEQTAEKAELGKPEAEEPERSQWVDPRQSPKEMPSAARFEDARVKAKAYDNVQPGAVTTPVGIELVWIRPGSFLMGSESGFPPEKPAHAVTISTGFYMSKYEVTQAQWREVMGDSPSSFKGDTFPVEQVSWNDGQDLIHKLKKMDDGYTYRLPTEAEWEYACLGGMLESYANNLDSVAWYDANSGNTTHPVGQKQPNNFGLYDMLGNVQEWCEDCYHENYHGAPANGGEWRRRGDKALRMVRGGSWKFNANNCRPSYRSNVPISHRKSDLGLRLVALPSR